MSFIHQAAVSCEVAKCTKLTAGVFQQQIKGFFLKNLDKLQLGSLLLKVDFRDDDRLGKESLQRPEISKILQY